MQKKYSTSNSEYYASHRKGKVGGAMDESCEINIASFLDSPLSPTKKKQKKTEGPNPKPLLLYYSSGEGRPLKQG